MGRAWAWAASIAAGAVVLAGGAALALTGRRTFASTGIPEPGDPGDDFDSYDPELSPSELDYLDCIHAMLDMLEPGDEEQTRVMLTHPPVPLEHPDGTPTLVAFWPGSYNRGKKRGRSHWHRAIDLRLRRRTPILAVCDGPVIVGPEGSQCAAHGGHCIRLLDTEVGLEWYYAHLDAPPLARPGDYVQAGQVIGFCGNSGNAKNTKCHLHLQCKHHERIPGVQRFPNFYCGLRRWFPKNPARDEWVSHCTKKDGECEQCIPLEEAEAWAQAL